MGRKSFYEEIRDIDCEEMTIVYLENGEKKVDTGTKEKIIQILKRIHANPKTMEWKQIIHGGGS